MKRRFTWKCLVMLLALAGGSVLPAHAHDYMVSDNWANFAALASQAQSIMDGMMTKYVGCNLWSTNCNGQTAVWTSVMGQQGPGWVPVGEYTADHAAVRWAPARTFIPANYQWAFLEEILKPGACVEGVAPARVQAIRNAFNANKNKVLTTEITLYGVNISAKVLGCNNKFTRNITTGGSISMGIEGGPFCQKVYTINEGIPSLFGTGNKGPLLSDAHPLLRDLLANMTAAYMTIGDPMIVDYWHAFMGRLGLTFVRELLPGILNSIGKSDRSDYGELGPLFLQAMGDAIHDISLDTEKGNKAFNCLPWGNLDNIYISQNVSGIPVIGSVTINVDIADSNICLTLRNFADKFNCANFTCLPDYLGVQPGQGDLNADGTRNIDSWFNSGLSLQEWKLAEGIGGYLDILVQPTQAVLPVKYGDQHWLQVEGASSATISYQWYSGYSPDELTPVSGATTQGFFPTMDVYSVGGTNMYKYYQAVLSATYCGAPHTLASDLIQIKGGTPPDIAIDDQPQGGNFFPGDGVNLSVKAGVAAGSGLTYQWQKFNMSTGSWNNMPVETSGVLSFPSVTPAQAGRYRVQISNQIAPSPLYSRLSDEAVVNVAPAIIIDPQPQGGELSIGGNHEFKIGASVSNGELSYRWLRNTGLGFEDISGWVSAGGKTFEATWDITNATIGDAGIYRCQIRNVYNVYGQYTVFSNDAVITISSGTVFRVDKNNQPGAVQDGLTWRTAFKTIQPAIDAAANTPGGGEVWVAGGPLNGAATVYNENRTQNWGGVVGSLILKDNVQVYGGFEGYRSGQGIQEQYRDQRVVAQNRAVIDGNSSRGGDPAYHVVVFGKESSPGVNTVLDGFIIQNGKATGVPGNYHTWRGGGIYIWLSSPTIANCRILNNTAAVAGGGIAIEAGTVDEELYAANAHVINCIIEKNTVLSEGDGSAGPDGGSPIRGGGGLFINGAVPTLNFLTIRDNTVSDFTPSPVGGFDETNWSAESSGILCWGLPETEEAVTLSNSIVWHPSAGAVKFGKPAGSTASFRVEYSILPNNAGTGNWIEGDGVTSADPLLEADSDLKDNSPAIDTGDPTIAAGLFTDRRGIPRPVGGNVDRGANEKTTEGPKPYCLTTHVNFTEEDKITDLGRVYDPNQTTSEAPIWKVKLEDKTFDCNGIPTDKLKVTVVDILGREAICEADIWVTETEAPVPVVNPAHSRLVLDNEGKYTLDQDDVWTIADQSYDNCYIQSLAIVPSLFKCQQAGKTTNVTLLVKDAAGNPGVKTVQLQIVDETPPTAEGGSLTVELDQFGQYVLTQDELAILGGRGVPPATDTSKDACGIAWGYTTADRIAFDCDDVDDEPQNIEVTIWDNHGNWATCNAEVEVKDVTPPELVGVAPLSFARSQGGFTEEQALAGITAFDYCSGDVSQSCEVEAFDQDNASVSFPISAPEGMDESEEKYSYRLVYTAEDASGNEGTTETTLTFYNLELPTITLNGSDSVVLECGTEYIDPGATAWDPNTGEDISEFLEVSIPVDKYTVDTFEVTYFLHIEDSDLYVQETRSVEVVDTTRPIIELEGGDVVDLSLGETFIDMGFTLYDACAWDLAPEDVVIGGDEVDTNTLGVYIITYDVNDGFLDAIQKTRTVVVGDIVRFTEAPKNTRLYNTSEPYTLSASYHRGVSVVGYQWYRSSVAQGLVSDSTSPNSVFHTVDPADHEIGFTPYNVVVYDDVFGQLVTLSSNTANLEVRAPLSAVDIDNITLREGDSYEMALTVDGGFGTRSYQWYRIDPDTHDLIALSDGLYPSNYLGPGMYAGTATQTLRFDPYTEAMEGQYEVHVTDAIGEDITGNEGGRLVVGPFTVYHGIGIPTAGLISLGALALSLAAGGAFRVSRKKNKA